MTSTWRWVGRVALGGGLAVFVLGAILLVVVEGAGDAVGMLVLGTAGAFALWIGLATALVGGLILWFQRRRERED